MTRVSEWGARGFGHRDDERRAAAVVRELHGELAGRFGVDLPLQLWDGTLLGADGADFRLVLHRPWSLRALFPASDLAAGEAYVEGVIDLTGDAVAALVAARQLAGIGVRGRDRLRLGRLLLRLPAPPPRQHTRRARLTGRPHTKERDRAAVAFHYDLPHEFYRLFLDRHLVYSDAEFADPSEDLETAQERKLDRICCWLGLRPGMRLLDVGCGWGSLLLHAARSYGVQTLGVTLSQTQVDAGRERVAAAGMAGRCEIRLQDYRDVTGSFDAVVSDGMYEHVGPGHYGEYFAAAARLTAAGGVFVNRGICVGDPHDVGHELRRTFVGTYVFPDGGLSPAWKAVHEMERAGFEILSLDQRRRHYALTLRHWLRRLEHNHDAVVRVTSEADYRIWRAYMAGSVISFEEGSLGLVQVVGVKRRLDGSGAVSRFAPWSNRLEPSR